MWADRTLIILLAEIDSLTPIALLKDSIMISNIFSLKHLQILPVALIIVLLFYMYSSPLAGSEYQVKEDQGRSRVAYVANNDGLDAIFLSTQMGGQVIFQCDFKNELILTPQINPQRNSISFVVDQGNGLRAVHLLTPFVQNTGNWSAKDSIITVVRGGAWPTVAQDGSLYLAMPSQETIELKKETDVYRYYGGEFTRLSQNQEATKHIWPMLDPTGERILFHIIPIVDGSVSQEVQTRSIILNLNTFSADTHFVNQNIFLEQWTNNGLILYSNFANVEARIRSYVLYDPKTGESKEIYRNTSRQAKLSTNSRKLATIRTEPKGSAQFDIFILDLETNKEINMTKSHDKSESLIGWIE